MSLVGSLICDCNNKPYPSKQSLNAHKKTKMHQAWETEVKLKNSKLLEKSLENEVHALKYENTKLHNQISFLWDRISKLEQEKLSSS